jgi:aldose 1-epimerase
VNQYFGATVGPVAGRIAEGRFRGGGLNLDLAPNEGTTHLHGGPAAAFDRVEWEVIDATGDSVEFRHVSVDGEDGYPGDVEVRAAYRLADDALHLSFTATTTRATPINLVNHTYFNLSGDATSSIVDHSLMIAASTVLAADERLLHTGGTRAVAGTALDFRTERRIGDRLPSGGEPWPGVDNTFVLDQGAPVAALLHDPTSGRTLEVTTTEPTLQVYTGNRIPRLLGRSGSSYEAGSGICLEAQRVPDASQLPDWPTIVVPDGGTYRQTTVWRFGTR